MFDGLKRAIALGAGRWLASVIGTAVAALVFAHAGLLSFIDQACSYISTPATLSAGVGGLVMALVCLIFNIKDKVNVSGKMAVTAAEAYQQGLRTQAMGDQNKIEAVATAMKAADQASKQDKASILAALKQGSF